MQVFHLFRPMPAGVRCELLRVTEDDRLAARMLVSTSRELTATTHCARFVSQELAKLGYRVEYGFLNDCEKYPTQVRVLSRK